MKLVIATLAAAGLACGSSAKQPSGPVEPPKPPGVLWASEPKPWHTPHLVYGRSVAGDVALLACANGWLTKLDLKTGKVLLDKRIAPHDVSFYDAEHLGNGKWIVVGLGPAGDPELTTTVAFAVDGATLEAKPIPLKTRPDKGYASPKVALTTEGVVIAGKGLPLAIYDPATWTIKATLDPALGWRQLATRGAILVANNSRTGTVRFDASTNGQRKLTDRIAWHSAVGDGLEVLSAYEGGKQIATIYEENQPPRKLPDSISGLAIDASGKRLVTATKTELRIHALPSGEITKRVPLGDIKFFSSLVPAGSRILFGHEGMERVFDLDTGTISAIDDGPARPHAIAVDLDGAVLLDARGAFRMQHGKVIGRENLPDTEVEVLRFDDSRRYTTSTNGRKSFQLRTFGTAAPSGSWDFSEAPSGHWIGRDGTVVFDYTHDGTKVLARTKGVNLITYAKRHEDAEAIAVDPDGDALISLAGRVAVLGADGNTRATIRVPGCEKTYAWGALEIGGARAATYSDEALAIWDRTKGTLLASARFERTASEVVLVPKRAEVLVQLGDDLYAWIPGKSLHRFETGGVYTVAASSDGKRLAIGFHDGHVVVYDTDAWLAMLSPATPWKPADVPPTCGDKDPLVPDPPAPEDPDDDDFPAPVPDDGTDDDD